jgi:hypothetical protein
MHTRRVGCGVVLVWLCGAMTAARQGVAQHPTAPSAGDTVEVTAGARYAQGGVHRFLLGGGYRDLWTTPIRVPVLDLSAAGGLRAVKQGGGMQTRSLTLEARDGREYRFRSLDKDPSRFFAPEQRGSIVTSLWQDQTSAIHPAGALVAARLLEAVGVPHPSPQLVVLPDAPALGEFRAEFAGLLGTFEEHPEEGEDDTPGFAGFRKVVGTDKLFERLNESPGHQVDARVYLTARLLDILLNDFDRHEGQWRWGAAAPEEPARWLPIPRDRDQAFIAYGGALIRLARMRAPKLVDFDSTFNLTGLTMTGGPIDRRLLSALTREAWDSAARSVRARLTDEVISEAVRRMPPPYYEQVGSAMEATLRARRDRIPRVAEAYYRRIARTVDVHATDADETADVTWHDDGAVTVAVSAKGARRPWYERRFVPEETREVRLYLHGGDDRARASGERRSPITVRVIGGRGDNELSDAGERRVRIYDEGKTGKEDVRYGPDSLVTPLIDRRPWPAPDRAPGDDHGGRFVPALSAGYSSTLGVTTGLELALERYGFRRAPYASRFTAGLLHASEPSATRFRVVADWQREASPLYAALTLQRSTLEIVRFYGLGNDTPAAASGEAVALDHRQLKAAVEAGLRGHRHRAAIGVAVLDARTPAQPGRRIALAPPAGPLDATQLGVEASFLLDTRDDVAAPARGLLLRTAVEAVPAVLGNDELYGRLGASASGYLPLPLPGTPVLALRGGGAWLAGEYPFWAAARVGGAGSLRGYDEDRFAGDAAAWGGAELRVKLGHVVALLPFDIGIHGLAEAGRVWLEGESSDGWHEAWGGGAWIAVMGRTGTLSLTLARGESRSVMYLRGGFGF